MSIFKKLIWAGVNLFLLILIAGTIFARPHVRKRETYLAHIDKNLFLWKLNKKEHPKWMRERIEKDFSDFKESNITSKKIAATYKTILRNAFQEKENFIRYRILDNQLYRYFSIDGNVTQIEPAFEKAIKTLLCLVKLPDVDLIYSDLDGMPLFFHDSQYYFTNPSDQAPILTRAKIQDAKYLVLIPDYNALSCDWKRDAQNILKAHENHPWQSKLTKAFWRGNLHTDPRYVISVLSRTHFDLVDAGIVGPVDAGSAFDKENIHKNFLSSSEHLQYKYLPVLDGYMCTYPGYQWRLLSNSLCLKQDSNEIQWFYDALKPYEHYVPIDHDMGDLIEKIHWAQAHDEECQKIVKNANNFMLENMMFEDNYLYLYKVICAYAKHQEIDRLAMKKEIKKEKGWYCVSNRRKANEKLQRRH